MTSRLASSSFNGSLIVTKEVSRPFVVGRVSPSIAIHDLFDIKKPKRKDA